MSGQGAGTITRTWRRRLVAIAALALLLLPSACGRRKLAPTQPGAENLPPEIVAVTPAPHTQIVLGDPVEISITFTTPLDSASVSARTVFLMIDTVRQPIITALSLDHRVIVVMVEGGLGLGTTYTVELSPELRSAVGVRFGRKFSWQFDVNSLRRPSAPTPPDRGTGISPFTMMSWTVNFAPEPDATSCQIFAGQDSAAVAAHAVTPIFNGRPLFLLPNVRWPQDGRPVFWTVAATNARTGDWVAGPVWRFTPVLPTARVDSLYVAADFSNNCYGSNTLCSPPRLFIGPDGNAGVVWNYWWSIPKQVRARMRLAGVRMSLGAAPGEEATLDASTITVWPTRTSWVCASYRLSCPPPADSTNGPLAEGMHVAPGQVSFESAALAAHLEATIRYLDWIDLHGYVLEADRVVQCVSPETNDYFPRALSLKLYYYP